MITQKVQGQWAVISPLLRIHNEEEYDRAITRLNQLLDEVGTNEAHPLYELLDTLGAMIHAYEERYHGLPTCSGAEVLEYLMEEHGLTQAELPEVGSRGVVSEVLRGKRELDVRQIRGLAARFHVSPSVFF